MKRLVAAFVLLAGSALAAQQPPAAPASTPDIDRDVWSVIIDTVKRDDIVGMGKTYHPDAVIVTPRDTQAIKPTLERWGRDMVTAAVKR